MRWPVAVGVAVLLGACSRHATATAAKPAELPVTAAEYRFDGPASVPAGVVRLTARNAGKLKHEFSVLRIGSTPVPQVLADFNRTTSGGPVPAYLGAAGGVSKLSAGDTASSDLALAPGRYLIVCSLTDADSGADAATGGAPVTAPPHDTLGMARELLVTRPKVRKGHLPARLPATAATIVAREYGFDLAGLHGGRNQVTFVNTGPVQLHHVVILEFPGLGSEADVRLNWEKLVAAGGGQPPLGSVTPRAVASAQPLDPGLRATFEVTLVAGKTYGFACFLSDRTGGPPHALANGMFVARTIG